MKPPGTSTATRVLALAATLTIIAILALGGLRWRNSKSSPSGKRGHASELQNELTAPARAAGAGNSGAKDAANAAAKTDEHRKKLDNLDTRPGGARGSDKRDRALAALRAKVPGVDVQFDSVTGAPNHIMAAGRFLAEAKNLPGDPYAPVRNFVNEHADLFGHDSTAMNDSRVTREDVTAHSGLRTVVWQQQVDGVPLYNTILKANITKDGALITLGSHFMSDPIAATGMDAPQRAALVAQPPVDVKKAVSLAAANLGDAVAPEDARETTQPQGAERMQRFSAPKISDTFAQLSWLPVNADSARLTWDVTLMSIARNEMFRELVDAQTGEVLLRTSLTADISNASYRVYADGTTLQPFDSPAPMSPGLSTPTSTQAPFVSRNLITTQALDTTASPNGWINDGGTDTYGNNVDAHLDTAATNPTYGTGTHASSPTRVFDFTLDVAQDPTTYQSAVVTSLFYACNYYHDKMYAFGFTESAGNFQQNNFGRGGNGNDAVLADAQDGSGTNNANFSTPADGSPGRMQMYIFTGPTPHRDGDLDMEIVFHEHTHGLSNRLVGGGVGISALQTAGMGEGWSDFYALCLLSQPGDDVNGNYAAGAYATYLFSGETANYYYGIRHYPYTTDMSKNPLTLKDIDPTQSSAHTGIPYNTVLGALNGNASEVHNQGEVWCVTLWEVRAALVNKLGAVAGNNMAIQLVTDGMKLAPANPTFLQSRDSIVQADLVDNGGANQNIIWAAFAKRGMGIGALVPANSTTTGVTENFDIPDDLSVTPIQPFASTGTRLSGPFSPTGNVYTLTNIGVAPLNWTAAKSQPWLSLSATSGTLAVGASTTVTATLDTVQLIALAAGNYSDTVTFTNTTDSAVISRTINVTVNPYLVQAVAFNLDTDPQWSRQGEWAYGTPTGAAVTFGARDPVAGYTGTKLFGIALSGGYSTATVGSAAYLTTGAINTTGMTGVTLRFKRWLGSDYAPYAYQTIDVSNDGVTWTNVFTNGSSAINDAAWTTQTYVLGAVADNRSTVYIRWGHRIGLTGAFSYCGWNIDDIEILAGSNTPTLTANSQSVSTPNGVAVPVTLTGTDTVNPGGPLTFAIIGTPNHGTLSGTAPNVTYTPNAGFYGTDTFSFTVDNGTLTSAPGGVAVTVLPGPPDIAVEQPAGTGLTDGVSTVAFGSVLAGAAQVRQFAVKNVGAGPLTISGASIDGFNAAEFSISGLATGRMDVGTTAYFTVTFAPTFAGAKNAALHILSDDPDEGSFDIVLTGTGTTPGGAVALTRDINRLPGGLSVSSQVVIGSQVFFLGTTLDAGTELWRTDGTAAGTYMVKDIYPGATSSSISSMTSFNGKLYFSANNSTNGQELWMSDGTPAGTVMVKDIYSGSISSSPGNFTIIGSTLFFSAFDATNGTELWKTDGTTAGTVLVANIAAGSTSSNPANFRNVNGTLFFTANDVTNGIELWKSDGTAVGTVLVKNITAGATSTTFGNFVAFGSTLIFSANDGVNGLELWASDGTAAGTILLKDINPGSVSSTPSLLTNIGSAVIFTATTAAEGTEIWRTDGTAAGTYLLKDIYVGTSSSTPGSFVTMGGMLYFTALSATEGTELWTTDGTVAGTVLVKDIYAGTSSGFPSGLTVIGSTLYFSANNGTNGTELWKSDGTAAGTVMLADIATGSLSSSPSTFTLVGSTIFFAATGDGASDRELWKTDGTAAGTVRVKDINLGSAGSSPASFVNLGGTLIFVANDGLTGAELWKSDGTDAGTVRLSDGETSTSSANLSNFRNLNGTLFFSATDGVNGQELWKSDGTLAGTVMVKDIYSGAGSSSPTSLTSIGNILYFSAGDSTNGTELWRSDGTNAGTVLVANIASTASSSSPTLLTPVGNTLFFSANDLTNGAELWKSDGTTAGTVLVANINTTAGTGSSLANLTDFNGTLFFSANDGVNGQELWKSDGTAAGTVLVADINPGSVSSSPANFRVIGTTLFFTATTAANGTELWKTDGTTAGTVIVSDLVAGTGSASPANLTVIGTTLFFSAFTSANGTELWKTDGTTVGTVLVKDIITGTGSSGPSNFANVNGTLFFSAFDGTNGTELWKSDGTAAGTVLVKDINTGTLNSSPGNMTNVAGTLYFTATTAAAGVELWKSDGTAAGTVQVADLIPGTNGSSPTNLTVVGNQLFFSARGPDVGSSELFVVNTAPPAVIAVEQPAGTPLTSGAATIDLGTVAIAGNSASKTFTIRNTGSQVLTITGITGDGADIAAFSFPSLAGTTIAPAATATFAVTLNPVSAGAKTAAIHIGSTSGSGNPFDIALTGTVITAPEIVVEQPAGTSLFDGSATVTFGDAVLGVPVVKTFTIRNIGSAELNLGAVTVDGANSGDFVAAAPSGSAIPINGSATLNVTFTPSATGARSAGLHIVSDDANESPFDVNLIGIGSAPAGLLRLVRDINQTGAGASITSPVFFGGSVYFSASTPDFGSELWKSDGTAAGTVMLKDISPGTSGSTPSNLTLIGSTLYFSAFNSTNGTELWKTDGTAAGTVMVKDIFAGSSSSSPANFVNVAGTLFFTATDSTANGVELWKSDGTAAGTVMVANINPIANGSSSPTLLTAVGTTLYFSANDGTNGAELWKSDGTAAGTVLVKDINTTAATGSSLANLTNFNGTLFFSANDGVNGQELWKSDGTAAGTVLVKDIYAGTTSSSPANFRVIGSLLYFTAFSSAGGTELWRTDGTTLGTVQVADIYAGASSSSPSSLTIVGTTLFFSAFEPIGGFELWKYDTVTQTASLVKDIAPGTASSSPANLANIAGTLYFWATDSVNGIELWKSDGTTAGTVMVRDLNPGSGSSLPSFMTDAGDGTFFMVASDGINGSELWKSDGSAAGTTLIKDIVPGTASASPSNLRVLNGALIFSASDGVNGTELWRSDPLTGVTAMLKDIYPGASSSSPGAGVVIGSTLYFSAFDPVGGTELWKTDGTLAGTVQVKDIYSGGSSSSPANLTKVGNTLYFSATDSTANGAELWKSDGTAAGTVLVANINPLANTGSFPANLTDFNGTLFFTANDGTNGTELWKSDGTAAGTVMVADINPGSASSSPANLRVIGSTLFFTATTAANGTELWKTDGTTAGTVLVLDIVAGATSSSPGNLTVVGSTLFFSAFTSATGTELWKSDGTSAGTVLVKDILAGTSSSNLANFVNFNGALFFSAADTANGVELWKSDGTTAGTVLVKDINPGTSASFPTSITNVYGTLYFSATTVANGAELWKSDGTAAGTVLVSDVRPGTLGSSPTNLTVVGSQLFFSATGQDLGLELWALDLGFPFMIVEQPAGTMLPGGVSSVDFGNATIGAGGSQKRTFTVRNTAASSALTGIALTTDGAAGTEFVGGNLGSVSVSPGGSTTFDVTFSPTSAGTRAAVLHIASNDPTRTSFDITLTGTGVAPTALEAWRLAHFGSVANTGSAADTADFDGDGVKNIHEWAFGMDPNAAANGGIQMTGTTLTARGLPQMFDLPDGMGGVVHYALFDRRKDALTVGLTYVVEFSDDLSTWTPSADVPSVVASDSEIEAVIVPLPPAVTDPAVKFFRVRVTAQ